MHVSRETPEQTDARLRAVIAAAELSWLDGGFAYREFSASAFPSHVQTDAVALVRDAAVWSVLVPANAADDEQFAVFCCHFPAGVDNSGFVGWLASTFKRELGTGVFVICGHNSQQGGIFDYWGVPLALRAEAVALLRRLR